MNSEQLQSCLSNEEPSIVVKQTFIQLELVKVSSSNRFNLVTMDTCLRCSTIVSFSASSSVSTTGQWRSLSTTDVAIAGTKVM